MKRRFVLTPRARQDVNDIWDYIADDNIEAADRVLGALDNAMVKLAKTQASATGAKNRSTSGTVSFWSIRT
jgi:plasmid stabilization system protein ParE